VRVENGSKGVQVHSSPGAQISSVVARNPRGPYPGGNCFAITKSDHTILKDFYCFSDQEIAWNGDSINAWRSSHVIIKDGIVHGNNGPTGMGVMFEGSEKGVHGGVLENIECREC